MAKKKSPSLKAQSVPLDELSEDSKNARIHDEKNLDAVRSSLKKFGQVEPLIVRKGPPNVVIGGNARLKVMRELGWSTASVVFVDLTDKQAAELGLVLNRSSELAAWDWQQIADLVNEFDIDSLSVGFDPREIEMIGAADWDPGSPSKDLDEFDQPEKEGQPIRLSREQRKLFDTVAAAIRRKEKDLSDGGVIELLCKRELER